MKLQLQIQTKLWTNLASTLLASPNPLVPMFSRLRMKFEMHMERLTSNQGWLKAATLTQCNSRIWLQTPISPHLIKPRLRWKRSLNIGIVLNLLLTQPLLLISYVDNPCNNFSVSWKTIKEEINGSFDLSKRIIQPKPDKDDEKWLVDVWKAPPAPLKNPLLLKTFGSVPIKIRSEIGLLPNFVKKKARSPFPCINILFFISQLNILPRSEQTVQQ